MGYLDLNSIIVTPLKRISTPGGDVLHALKDNDFGYKTFGESYFSLVDFNAIKAWKRHSKMIMNLVVPIGLVKFVFNISNESEFREEEIGVNNYVRLTVPPGIWFGFKGMSKSQSLIMNIASIRHDPNEVESCSISDLIYTW